MDVQPWMLLEEPKSYARNDILEYFGIPPQPEEALAVNIGLKRKHWANRMNGVGNKQRAKAVKDWIQSLSKILEDGAFPDGPIVRTEDGGFAVLGEPQTPQELADQLGQFLLTADVAQVLELIRAGMEKWPDDEEVLLIAALALSELVRDHFPRLNDEWRGFADQITSDALAARPHSGDAWLARARCAVANERYDEIESFESRAQGLTLPVEIYGIFATTAFRRGNVDAGVRNLIRQVDLSAGDPGMRSLALEMMLREVVIPLLPIVDARGAAAYKEAVEVAAWLANGVPEAEAEVLKYRIWARQAVDGIFIGDLTLKSFIGVLSGFLALPLFGTAGARPAWRVLRDGPLDAVTWRQWLVLSAGDVVEEVHARANRHFDWETPGVLWPTRDEVVARLSKGEATTFSPKSGLRPAKLKLPKR